MTGRGIEADDLPRVFQPFFRSAAARRRGMSGTGLGLAIAQRIAHTLRGKLEVQSQPNQGSCFTMIFPKAPANPPLSTTELTSNITPTNVNASENPVVPTEIRRKEDRLNSLACNTLGKTTMNAVDLSAFFPREFRSAGNRSLAVHWFRCSLPPAPAQGEVPQRRCHGAGDKADEGAGINVRAVAAELRTIKETVVAFGRCEALPERVASPTPGVEGQVATLLAKVGDTVKQNQPIVQLDSHIAQANLAEKSAARDG